MRSLLTTFIILSAIGATSYFFVQKNQVLPTQSMVTVAKDLPQYPNATSWEVDVNKKFCVESFFECGNTIPVTFTTQNSWSDIYSYYRKQMIYDNWKSNSQIYTSIPGSVIFTKENCEAELAPNQKFNNDAETGSYNFQVSCNMHEPGL